MKRLTAQALDIPGMAHGFFGREGGVSAGLYQSLNCGPGSRDDAQKVLTDYWDSLKAAVDHDSAPDAEPQPAPTEGT